MQRGRPRECGTAAIHTLGCNNNYTNTNTNINSSNDNNNSNDDNNNSNLNNTYATHGGGADINTLAAAP